MTIKRFEDLESWKKARTLTRQIYEISGTGAFSRDFALRDQVRRASVSVMSNIAEGFERDGNREFAQFLAMAKGSVGELKSQFYIALDAGFIDDSEFTALYGQADEIGKLIAGLRRYLLQSELRGKKMPH
jgi:four helix bundle protein